MYKESLNVYFKDLAAKKPAPGGGSASSLAASIGVSLISMVCNFTLGKDKYKDHEFDIKNILASSDKLLEEFLNLVDEDVVSYQKLASAYQLPRESEEDRKRRAEAIEEGLKSALSVPLKICKLCHRAALLCLDLVKKGNANLISDVGVAIELLSAAFLSAKLNVEINSASLKDEKCVLKVKEEISPLEKEIQAIKNEVSKDVSEIIRRPGSCKPD